MLVPEDFIRGGFFSKAQLTNLLSQHDDASGLFFYIIPNTSGASKFTMYAEPFDPKMKRYPEQSAETSEVISRDLGDNENGFGLPCPPKATCPD
jgi:hypothetical protein